MVQKSLSLDQFLVVFEPLFLTVSTKCGTHSVNPFFRVNTMNFKKNSIYCFCRLWVGFFSCVVLSAPIQVRVHFQESLAERDTLSGSRYKEDYEKCIELSKKRLQQKLATCGYEILSSTFFYDSRDPLQAKENATKVSTEKIWLIVGPRRSNHYVLATLGAKEIPSVSTMAGSKEVFTLGPDHLTLGIDNSTTAQALVETVNELSQKLTSGQSATLVRPSYVTIVNEDCIFCTDLSKEFDLRATGLEKIKEIKVVGDSPDIQKIRKDLGALKPDYILVPNYSQSSVKIMAGIHALTPKSVFLGGDGWGTQSYGFVQSAANLEGVVGYSARGTVPTDMALKTFPLGQSILQEPLENNPFLDVPAGVAVVRILSGLSDTLCENKPKTFEEFKVSFTKTGPQYFSLPWGVGIYKLNGSRFVFYKEFKK
jgi:hypothetical protein